jgi:hypothetical protein
VRKAFGEAVDWRRMVLLADSAAIRRSPIRWSRRGSPVAARPTSCRSTIRKTRAALLAEAGFPGGKGFPETVMLTGGSRFDKAIVDEVKRSSGSRSSRRR